MEGLLWKNAQTDSQKLLNEDLDTLTYRYIRNTTKNMHKARLSYLLPVPTDIEETHEALSVVLYKFERKMFAC
jgi:hypothetical protein